MTFFRFPHTAHLAWVGADQPRGDKVLSAREAATFLSGEVVLEEKVDGANLGLSLDAGGELRLQNRGEYLVDPYAGQFRRLPSWLVVHGEAIEQALQAHIALRLMLFGEWCAARHSIEYSRLPDWFLLFDVFEAQTGRFWSSMRRDALAMRLGLETTPRLASGHFSLAELIARVGEHPSRFRDGPMEGIVVRSESEQYCDRRAKLVSGAFSQAINAHWRRGPLVWNRLAAATSSREHPHRLA